MSIPVPTPEPQTMIEVAGRRYRVEVTGTGDYWLFGPRAKYRTFRNSQGNMFLVSFTKPGTFRPDPLGRGVWLTDRDGALRVL